MPAGRTFSAMAMPGRLGRGRTGRDYPPLGIAGALSLVLLAVLPSALNLPQANPGQTLEYAPIPPEDGEQVSPRTGNLSSLGLGASGSFRQPGSSGGGGPAGTSTGVGAGKNPSTKRCIGTPPRQTEDPLAPPCVAYFNGDNGGATYQGVTRDEVRILFYFDTQHTEATSRGVEARPENAYFDLEAPPQDDDNVHVRGLRAYQTYFNDRYQLYGRRAHFFVYFGQADPTPESRRAEAAENFERVRPFAVLAVTAFGFAEEYLEVMARRGVMNFGSVQNRSAAYYEGFAGLAWGYLPTVEMASRFYSSYICDKVQGRPVSFGGNDGDPDSRLHNGAPRRLGLLRTTDAERPELIRFAALVKTQVQACGGEFVSEQTLPSAGWVDEVGRAPAYAEEGIAAFRQAGVTTVVWAGGFETNYSKAAARQRYLPEWVVAGDGVHEGRNTARVQDPEAWAHAWVTSPVTLVDVAERTPCYDALSSVEPGFPDAVHACPRYDDLRQMFTGIQVAGPRLSPRSVEKGFRAIPAVASRSNRVPACYYEPGDYTCVKDSVAMWWDPEGTPEGANEPGCWRMVHNGRRFLINGWTNGDVLVDKNPSDVCNNYAARFLFRIAA